MLPFPKITVIFAGFLILLGLGAYAASGTPTAAIPSYFGIAFMITGLVSLKESLLKHGMHAAMGLALLTVIAMGPMVFKGPNPERPLAFPIQLTMFLSTIVYLALGVNSFIQARKRQKQAEASS